MDYPLIDFNYPFPDGVDYRANSFPLIFNYPFDDSASTSQNQRSQCPQYNRLTFHSFNTPHPASTV